MLGKFLSCYLLWFFESSNRKQKSVKLYSNKATYLVLFSFFLLAEFVGECLRDIIISQWLQNPVDEVFAGKLLKTAALDLILLNVNQHVGRYVAHHFFHIDVFG